MVELRSARSSALEACFSTASAQGLFAYTILSSRLLGANRTLRGPAANTCMTSGDIMPHHAASRTFWRATTSALHAPPARAALAGRVELLVLVARAPRAAWSTWSRHR